MTWDPTIPPIRSVANPLIPHSETAWRASQVYDLTVIPDQLDDTKLLGFMTGMTAPVKDGTQSIGLFHSTVADFETWLEHGGLGNGQILQPTGNLADFDYQHVRLGCVVPNPITSEYWIFYTGYNGSGTAIGLAIAPYAHPEAPVRYSGNPILTISGDETVIQTCSVIPPWVSGKAYWVMDYEYRRSNGYQNARFARSTDGKTAWTKTGSGDIIPVKPDGTAYPGPEFHQLVPRNSKWYRIFEAGSVIIPFAIFALESDDLEGPYVPVPLAILLIGPSGKSGAYDEVQLATGYLAEVGGVDRLFFCGTVTTDPFIGHWSIGVASYNGAFETVGQDTFTKPDGTSLIGDGAEVGSWIANDGTFKIVGGKAVPNSSVDNDSIVMDVDESDVVITVTVVPRASGGNQSSPGFIFRQVDDTHNYFTHFSVSSLTFDVYENPGATLRHTIPVAISDNGVYILKYYMQGACLAAYINDVEAFVVTDVRLYADATMFGPRLAFAGAPPGDCSWDDLLIQKISAITIITPTMHAGEDDIGMSLGLKVGL